MKPFPALLIIALMLAAMVCAAVDVILGDLQSGLTWSTGSTNKIAHFLSTGNDTYTKYLLHADGTNNQTATIDSSALASTVTICTNAKITTNKAKFGTASFYFTGTTDCVSSPYSSTFDVSSNDFTVDAWVYATSTNSGDHIIFQAPNAAGYDWLHLIRTGSNIFFYSSSTSNSWAPVSNRKIGTITISNWTHVAVGRNGTNMYYWLGGVQGAGSPTNIGTVALTKCNGLRVGNTTAMGGQLVGCLDEVRFTAGLCRWTSNFTPSTTSYGE